VGRQYFIDTTILEEGDMHAAQPISAPAWMNQVENIFFFSFSFFIIPLSFYPGIFDPGLSLRMCLLSVLIAVLSTFRFIRTVVFRREPHGLPKALMALYGGYFLMFVISIFPAMNKSEALAEIAKVFLFVSYVWFASDIIRRFQGRFHVVANYITLSSFFISLWGILEYWGKPIFLDNGDVGPGATMINRNLLSSYLFLCLGFTIISVFSTQRRSWRFIGVLAYASILYVFLATQTRAVWLGCVGGLLFTAMCGALTNFSLFLSFVRGKKKLLLMCALIFSFMIAVGFLLRPLSSNQATLTKRASTIFDSQFDANHQRILIWQKTLHMFRDHPVFGVGAGNWKIHLPRYGTSELVHPDMSEIEIRPYNDFLWVLAETGPLGLILYCGLFALAGFSCIRVIRNGTDCKMFFLPFALLLTLSGFAIISCFDFPKERIEHLVVFGFILSLCASLNGPPRLLLQLPKKRDIVLTGLLLLCSSGCLLIGGIRLKGDINNGAMRNFWINRQWQSAISAADRAFSPLYTMEPTSTPLHWYRGVANFKLGNIDQALIDYQKAYSIHPQHLNVLNDLGTCLSLKGDSKRAIQCYRDALAISPYFEPALINLAAVYYNFGKIDSAYCIISKVKSPSRDPRFDSFYRAISQKAGKGKSP
jgi:O-antigen ligase